VEFVGFKGCSGLGGKSRSFSVSVRRRAVRNDHMVQSLVKAAATKDGRDGDENPVSDACHDPKSDKVILD